MVADTFSMAEILRAQYEKVYSTPASLQTREEVDYGED